MKVTPIPTRRNIWEALDTPLRLPEIAEKTGIPLRFCQRMVWDMKRDGFLRQRVACHYERAS